MDAEIKTRDCANLQANKIASCSFLFCIPRIHFLPIICTISSLAVPIRKKEVKATIINHLLVIYYIEYRNNSQCIHLVVTIYRNNVSIVIF